MSSKIIKYALPLAVGGYLALSYIFSKKEKCSDALLPALEEEEVASVMQEFLEKTKYTSTQLLKMAEKLKAQIQAQGQDIDDKILYREYILPQFEVKLKEIQDTLYSQYDLNEDEVEEAFNFYAERGNKTLCEVQHIIQAIYREFGGDTGDSSAATGEDSSLNVDDFCEVLEALVTEIEVLMEAYVSNFVETHGTVTPMLAEAFNMGIMRVTEGAEEEIFARFGVSKKAFHDSFGKHSSSSRVMQLVAQIQYMSQEVLQRHGINPQQ